MKKGNIMRGKVNAGEITNRQTLRQFDKRQVLSYPTGSSDQKVAFGMQRLGQDGAGQRQLIPADESIYHPRFHEQKQIMMQPDKRLNFESRLPENTQRSKEIQRRYLMEQKSVKLQKKKIDQKAKAQQRLLGGLRF